MQGACATTRWYAARTLTTDTVRRRSRSTSNGSMRTPSIPVVAPPYVQRSTVLNTAGCRTSGRAGAQVATLDDSPRLTLLFGNDRTQPPCARRWADMGVT